MGGKSGKQESVSTVYNSSLPEYAEPYYKNIMASAQAEANTPYTPYPGQKIADISPYLDPYKQGIEALNPDLSGANEAVTAGWNLGMGTTFDPSEYNVNDWSSAAAERYMNPYITNVLDVTKQRAYEQFARDNLERATRQQRAGAFGGSRRFVENSLAKQAFDRNIQETEALALADAYEKAYGMFDTDKAKQLAAQQATDQSNQFGAQFGLQQGQLGLESGKTLGALEELGYGMDSQTLGMMKEMGLLEQAQAQTELDVGYKDFLNQLNYNKDNLAFQAGLMAGIPVGTNQTTNQFTPTPNALSQLAGLGMGVYGLSQAQKAAT